MSRNASKAAGGNVILLLGIGNENSEQDSFGIALAKKFLGRKGITAKICHTAPENFISFIRKSDITIAADCAEFGGKRGEVRLLKNPRTAGRLSTHYFPLSKLAEFCKGDFYLLAYQRGGSVKKGVEKAEKILAHFLIG